MYTKLVNMSTTTIHVHFLFYQLYSNFTHFSHISFLLHFLNWKNRVCIVLQTLCSHLCVKELNHWCDFAEQRAEISQDGEKVAAVFSQFSHDSHGTVFKTTDSTTLCNRVVCSTGCNSCI